jgi:mono/diheme cytochrome c family protein
LELEQPGTGKLFRSNDNLYDYGYLLQTATNKNPDALPVGFVKDTYRGKDYLGFSCAACHTGQVNYRGVGIRIDGGPAGSDMETFLKDLAKAMRDTQENDNARAQFVKRVLDRGNYSSAKDVEADLKTFSQRLNLYVVVNRSPTRYGYYRLDAFGRIYNRVLEHIITQDQLKAGMRDMVKENDLTEAELEAILSKGGSNVLDGKQRDHLVLRLTEVIPSLKTQLKLRDKIFNCANAPVSYPFLWDIPQHDYVQWNGLAPNAGLGSVGRNAGEVIGVFATLEWSEKKGFSLPALISGQGLKWKHINFNSSVDVHNLRRLEHHLSSLQSPLWPKDLLGGIDEKRSRHGEALFSQFCASCHTRIDRSDPDRRIVANITKLKDVGTDPTMAMNAIQYDGLSGILRNEYTTSGGGPVLINERAPVAALLTKATLSVVATPRPDKGYVSRLLDWADDLITAFFNNEIKPSIKQGNYDPDTTADPYASLRAYKARSLNGIWATAPYLHNGSVPTLYDLLLPKRGPKGPAGGEYRPDKFMVGSREFDTEKVGLKSSGYNGFLFNTALDGNSNAGHLYGTKVLSRDDRLDLLEFLKSL